MLTHLNLNLNLDRVNFKFKFKFKLYYLVLVCTSCHGSEKKGFESATHHPSPPVGLSFGTDACMVSGSKACAPNELQGVLYPNSKKYVWPG